MIDESGPEKLRAQITMAQLQVDTVGAGIVSNLASQDKLVQDFLDIFF
jgi:hypothetical protein